MRNRKVKERVEKQPNDKSLRQKQTVGSFFFTPQ